LIVKIYNKETFKSELLGEVVVPISTFKDGKPHSEWYRVGAEQSKKSKHGSDDHIGGTGYGEFHITARFTGGSEDIERKISSSKDKKIKDVDTIGKMIGSGAFSQVFYATSKADNKPYAIKAISKSRIEPEELKNLRREIDILRKLSHPHIIQLIQVFETPANLSLVLEYVEGGELFDAIVARERFSEWDAVIVIKQVLEAIQYCHQNGVAHRDLKPDNLLLANSTSQDFFIKLADFGLAKDFAASKLNTFCGSPDYVAPEILEHKPYGTSVDIWSIGVITYVLLCGYPPFYGESQFQQFKMIVKGQYEFPPNEWNTVSDEAKNFIARILVVNPQERATSEECLEDPFITNFSPKAISSVLHPEPLSNTKKERDLSKSTLNPSKFKEYTETWKKVNGRTGPKIPSEFT